MYVALRGRRLQCKPEMPSTIASEEHVYDEAQEGKTKPETCNCVCPWTRMHAASLNCNP